MSCQCDFCTGAKSIDDNWCPRCGRVLLVAPKHWEHLDVCDACEVEIETEMKAARSGKEATMSDKIQHDPEAFMLALASAWEGDGVRVVKMGAHLPHRERWERVARCAVEHLARDAAASAAAGAAEVAQGAAMKVLERMLDILTPEQTKQMLAIMADLRAVPS